MKIEDFYTGRVLTKEAVKKVLACQDFERSTTINFKGVEHIDPNAAKELVKGMRGKDLRFAKMSEKVKKDMEEALRTFDAAEV